MKANKLNKSEENGYYIDWLLNHFMFGYRARPKGDNTLFEINEKWVFADKNTARLYCDKLNEAMVKSGRMQETHPIKDIERGTRVYVPGWSTEEGYFQPLKAFFEPLVQHMFRQVFLTEEHCRNYCNHLNKFVKEVEPK